MGKFGGMTKKIFGGSDMVSTMTPEQQAAYSGLISGYQKDIAKGPQADTKAVGTYLDNVINPEITKNANRNIDESMGQMGTNFWGTSRLSALGRLQQQRSDDLNSARFTAMENERNNAQNRYDNARAGLSGLMNVQTQALQHKAGFLDRANQVIGTGANIAEIYSLLQGGGGSKDGGGKDTKGTTGTTTGGTK